MHTAGPRKLRVTCAVCSRGYWVAHLALRLPIPAMRVAIGGLFSVTVTRSCVWIMDRGDEECEIRLELCLVIFRYLC